MKKIAETANTPSNKPSNKPSNEPAMSSGEANLRIVWQLMQFPLLGLAGLWTWWLALLGLALPFGKNELGSLYSLLVIRPAAYYTLTTKFAIHWLPSLLLVSIDLILYGKLSAYKKQRDQAQAESTSQSVAAAAGPKPPHA